MKVRWTLFSIYILFLWGFRCSEAETKSITSCSDCGKRNNWCVRDIYSNLARSKNNLLFFSLSSCMASFLASVSWELSSYPCGFTAPENSLFALPELSATSFWVGSCLVCFFQARQTEIAREMSKSCSKHSQEQLYLPECSPKSTAKSMNWLIYLYNITTAMGINEKQLSFARMKSNFLYIWWW